MTNFFNLALLGQEGVEKYSLSPTIYKNFFTQFNMEGNYQAIPVKCENLFDKIKELQSKNYTGLNITIPHKINVLPILTDIDISAEKIGSVNTILFKGEKIIGYNTDNYGFIENLNQKIPNWNKNTNIKVIVYGAGGATKAIISALLNQQNITSIGICNRTNEKAEQLANYFGKSCYCVDYKDRNNVLKNCNLLINTTSAGMVNYEPLDVNLKFIQNHSIIYDIVYNPRITSLLQQAINLEEKSLQVVFGIGMLYYQAQKSFEIWFDKKPNVLYETI